MSQIDEELVEAHLEDADIMAKWAFRHGANASSSLDLDDLRQEAIRLLIEFAPDVRPELSHDVGGYIRWKLKCGLIDYLRISGTHTRSGARRDPVLSLDESLTGPNEQENTLLDLIPAEEPEEQEEREVDPAQLSVALAAMTERERRVITRHYLDDLTWAQIAREMNISEARIHQLQTQAIGRAREALGLDPAAAKTKLTDRQLQVLYCAAEGLTTDETAERLHMSVETTKSHRQNMIKSLEAKSMIHVLALAFRRGLIV